jgi:hypothetical protein
MAVLNIFFPPDNLPLLSIWNFFEGYHQVTLDYFTNHQQAIPFTHFVLEYDPVHSILQFEPVHIFLEYDPLTFGYIEHSIGFTFNPSNTKVCLSIISNESDIKRGYIGLHYTPIGGIQRRWNNDDDDDDWRRYRPRKPKPRPVFSSV